MSRMIRSTIVRRVGVVVLAGVGALTLTGCIRSVEVPRPGKTFVAVVGANNAGATPKSAKWVFEVRKDDEIHAYGKAAVSTIPVEIDAKVVPVGGGNFRLVAEAPTSACGLKYPAWPVDDNPVIPMADVTANGAQGTPMADVQASAQPIRPVPAFAKLTVRWTDNTVDRTSIKVNSTITCPVPPWAL